MSNKVCANRSSASRTSVRSINHNPLGPTQVINAIDVACRKLRAHVCSNGELSFLMEAHDGLSATIAQRSGFKGLWASGLSIASSLGYRDADEASWSQLADAVERIVDSSQLPVLVDGDGGFGNCNNARLLARKLLQRGGGHIWAGR